MDQATFLPVQNILVFPSGTVVTRGYVTAVRPGALHAALQVTSVLTAGPVTRRSFIDDSGIMNEERAENTDFHQE